MAFTPKPWKWGPPDSELCIEPRHWGAQWLEDANGKIILEPCGSCLNILFSKEIGDLIAAAPDLLEALELITIALIDRGCFEDDRPEWQEDYWPTIAGKTDAEIIEKARAAIAKAKGE